MAQERNGSLTRWTVGVGLTALLAAASWGVVGVKDTAEAAHALAWQAKSDVRVLETEKANIERRLMSIETKLDELLKRK